MSALERFDFGAHGVRVVMIDDAPWFVASDVAAALEYDRTSNMTRLLDEDERGTHNVSTPGGMQEVTVISEPGVHSAIMRSRSDRARDFRRWVTHDVLPSILRTGSYTVPETPEQLMARAVIQAQELLAKRDTQIAELKPRAEAWDEIASADGDYSVADASKMLARAGVETGPQRLFKQLEDLRWIFRGSDGKWRAYAGRVDSGHLAERAQSHYHPVSGELVIDAPQVRVTLRGLERLRVRLGVLTAMERAS